MEMENPFFIDRRWFQQPDPIHERKSVRIPVRFVRSEQVDRTGSAVKIQKVFRGFMVRKCMKKVKDVKVVVDQIQEKLLNSEVVELLRKDERERIRMSESLMSLLFKLDSICGVDFGVRVCRKAVIRKAIALQERIDAIAAVDLGENEIEISNLENSKDLEDSGNIGEADVIDCDVKDKRNRELLERIMEESEKMTKLMNEFYEKSEMQTKMVKALTNQVKMLEKALFSVR